jgi:hypothetical protein
VLFVCLLIVGVAALAIRAKSSQYPRQSGFSRHLSKATKMTNDRTQKSVVAYCPERPVFEIPAPVVEVEFVPSVPVRPPQQGFLESFHFRPPPVLL